MTDEIKDLLLKMNKMEEELVYIKEHMLNKDEVMLKEDYEAYVKSLDKNNLISEKEAKEELDL